MQTLSSSQLVAVPGRQAPALQRSPDVQAFPSLQDAVLFEWAHPPVGLQESSVQAFPSSQLRGSPPRHEPPSQRSFVVQVFPSSHAEKLLGCVQVPLTQVSVVHGLLSWQFAFVVQQRPLRAWLQVPVASSGRSPPVGIHAGMFGEDGDSAPLKNVPSPLGSESSATVPDPSFRPHRPRRLESEVIC